MDEQYIRELANRLLDGTATKEEENQLHEWYDSQQNATGKDFIIESGLSKSAVRNKILSKLRAHQELEGKRQNTFPNWKIRIAAAIVLLAVASAGIYIYTQKQATEWITATVPLGETNKVILPDSSIVWLNAGSSLRYPTQFETAFRQVELVNGQAFFDVHKNPSKPFRVYTGELMVSVLGTSFDVKSYSDEKDAKVEVLTGQVEVGLRDQPTARMLDPGKVAIIQKTTGQIAVTEKASDYIGTWMKDRIAFYDEPMRTVLKALERNYNIEIYAVDEAILNKPLTIKLDKQPLTDILEVLKYIFDFNYQLINHEKKVIITK